MRDQLSIARVAELHPAIRDEVKRLIEEAESKFPATVRVRVAQGLRTFAEQDALYAQGRTKPGIIVTKAKGGLSNHNYGTAWDGLIMVGNKADWNSPYWKEVVATFKAAGYTWGGDWKFKDMPHLEKMFGNTIRTLLARHTTKDFLPGTNYVRL